jgi:two-component system, OmpR family, sensor histidine kinase BaeS
VRSLALKLSLLFMIIALMAVGVVAIWTNHSVQTAFTSYCQKSCPADTGSTTLSQTRETGNGSIVKVCPVGSAEQAFLNAFRNSLWLAALVAVIASILLALLFSRLITRPLKAVTLSAQKVAAGDFSQRVSQKTRDEIGQVSAAFNSMAEQLNKKEQSRRQLVADIAHELRTPLTTIQGNLEAWRDGVIAPTPEKIALVHDETVLLSRIITDLRDLSLIEGGWLKMHQLPTNLVELVNNEISSISNQAQEHNILLHNNLPVDLPRVFIDAGRIRQVLRNLLVNALRYTNTGGDISIKAISSSGGWLTVAVSDTGSGIAAEDLPYIFDHLYKSDHSRQRGHSGSGLGLAIVKQFVQAHGGKVWAESQPGEGSTFYFTLPLAQDK